ncbi:unnamed protein product [Victoria cruziana]
MMGMVVMEVCIVPCRVFFLDSLEHDVGSIFSNELSMINWRDLTGDSSGMLLVENKLFDGHHIDLSYGISWSEKPQLFW